MMRIISTWNINIYYTDGERLITQISADYLSEVLQWIEKINHGLKIVDSVEIRKNNIKDQIGSSI